MSFGEILLIFVIGLVVLGPERLPVAIKTVAGWIRVLRSLSMTVQTELAKELKLEEVKETLAKAQKAGLQDLSPEMSESMEELRKAAESMQKLYQESGNQMLSQDLQRSNPSENSETDTPTSADAPVIAKDQKAQDVEPQSVDRHHES